MSNPQCLELEARALPPLMPLEFNQKEMADGEEAYWNYIPRVERDLSLPATHRSV